ncbi:MAG TPA: ATP synthase subunit I [Actinophytocola sp.]|uniref:ATP synthase subunit I n=1 Tax=Actinophytocola sp. TaxID=1872138 RepID=UPI002DDD83A7|nr:ATP synthase subunit I [Actinophytocola sp.]HEV2779783.1 ATP synthase subunit I [Actinophytocola sp.]
MSAFQAAAAKVPAEAVLNLRRPLIIASVVGAVGLLVCGLLGHIVMGILLIIGLGLGVFNTRLLQRSVVKVISSENPSRTAIGRSSVPRLLLITGLAVALGIFLKPDGFGVFLGLAVFQVIILGTTALPVMKERRQ